MAAYSLSTPAADEDLSERKKITLRAPDPNLPLMLAGPRLAILPADRDRRHAGIGTGLYAVRRFDPGRQFIGTRVAAHRKDGREGWFDEVELVSIPSETVRAEALRDGLVDAADITALDPYCDRSEFHCLPNAQRMQHVVHNSISMPAQLGTVWPLDNLAMARRWWKTG